MDFSTCPFEKLTDEILGACVEVHRTCGPGLLESVYEACLAHELAERRVPALRQVALQLAYKGLTIPNAARADLIVVSRVIVELKAVESLLPVHAAQLRTYLRLTGLRVGLLVNFHGVSLTGQIRRVVVGASF